MKSKEAYANWQEKTLTQKQAIQILGICEKKKKGSTIAQNMH